MALTEFDSLVIGGKIETLGGPDGVASVVPAAAGCTFKLQPGYDLGNPQPVQDFIASLMVDGERPQGTRASDRTPAFTIDIHAPDFASLAKGREFLYKTINQDFWTMTWTRHSEDGDVQSFPIVFDCFRALPSTLTYGGVDQYNNLPIGRIGVQFMALPYGRADVQTQVSFATPVASLNAPPPPAAPVVLDNFGSINSPQFQQSSQCIVGPNTAFWDPGFGPAAAPDGAGTPLLYGNTFTTPLNLTGLPALNLYFGLGSRYYGNLEFHGRSQCHVEITLTDANGVVLTFSADTKKLPVSQDPSAPAFSLLSLGIPQTHPTFNYAQVISYFLTMHNRAPGFDNPRGELRWLCAYLDNVVANPPSTVLVSPSVRGNVIRVSGVGGTVRTQCSLQFQAAPTPGTPTSVTTVGGGTYTVPSNTLYLKAEAVGGGGAGASETAAGVGGGGGGGEYAAEANFTSVVAQVIPYNVGAAGTSGSTPVNGGATIFGPGPSGPLTVIANGGVSALQNTITGAAGGAGSVNSVHFPGGTGRTASGSVGGGGGSSGGSAGPGLAPVGTASTVFTSGASNWTCPAGVFQVLAECWGAGGGGGNNSVNSQGGGGGGGEYAAQLVNVTPTSNYPYSVGSGGSGNSGSGGGTGGAGNITTFQGDTQTVTAHGGSGGFGSFFGGGTAAGGSGSSNATHHNGGSGGSSYPYTGGGGSSAGPSQTGNSGGTPGAGIAPSDGGNGGAGSGPGSSAGTAGSNPGGGGGGANASGHSGGAGASGKVRLTFPGGAPTNNGGAAVTGGGAGGAGGPTSNTAGTAGSQPGGGGGGAFSGGTSEAGGAGGAGKLIITPFQLPQFKHLLVHRPSVQAPVMLNPFVPVGAGLVAPGATEYTVPSLVSGVNATFNGTYMIWLNAASFNSPSSARTISVSVKQYEIASGASTTVTTTPVSVTPSTQVVNGMVCCGALTLPNNQLAADNTAALFTAIVTDSNTSDRFNDALFLDTRGQTIQVNEPSTGYVNYYFDEPDPTTTAGKYLGSQVGRPQAVSVMANTVPSGGPVTLEPGDNLLLVYSADGGAPYVQLGYFERYAYDRTG